MHLQMVYDDFHATIAEFSWERLYGLKILNPFIIWPFMGKNWQPLYCNNVWHCSITQSHQSCPTLGDFMSYSMPGFHVLHHLLGLAQTHVHSVMPSNHLGNCHPFSSCPQSFSASGPFSVSWLFIWWPKYWSFSFSISPCSEHSGLISFRTDWFDLLVSKGGYLNANELKSNMIQNVVPQLH